MWYYIIKTLLSAVIIVVISEVAKRSSLFGGLIASLPLTSLLAVLWLYIETKDTAKIIQLTEDIFWLVIPSLALFISLPLLLKKGINFYISLFLSISITIAFYGGTLYFMENFNL